MIENYGEDFKERYGSNWCSTYCYNVTRSEMQWRTSYRSKVKETWLTFLSNLKFRDAKGSLEMRYCLHDAIINAVSRIGKIIDKNELYL